jgi:hypothetical protein
LSSGAARTDESLNNTMAVKQIVTQQRIPILDMSSSFIFYETD